MSADRLGWTEQSQKRRKPFFLFSSSILFNHNKRKKSSIFSKKFQKNKIEKNRKNQFSENSNKFAVPKIPKNNFQKISAILRFPVIFTKFSENYSSNGASP